MRLVDYLDKGADLGGDRPCLTTEGLSRSYAAVQELSADIAAALGVVARVAVRINPDVEAGSHPHISTGLKINKFGIPAGQARTLLSTLSARRALQLVALHVHVG